MIRLNEVFGISQKVPTHTYVDRASLDIRLRYLLESDRHIVIYGASKQGKTSLRRKVLADEKSVVVRCLIDMTVDQIYENILGTLGAAIPAEIRQRRAVSGKLGAEVAAEGEIPLFAKASGKVNTEATIEGEGENTYQIVGVGSNNINWIAARILESGKRVVLEDFHYLDQAEQKRLAFDLKALWDAGVFFMIVGIWAEQNLLSFFNSDLTGRVEELNLAWTNRELSEVLTKGEEALNIIFPEEVKAEMISDAYHNVGLLQRLAEKYCYYSSIFQGQPGDTRVILDKDAYATGREAICSEERQRYRQFVESMREGFKGYSGTELKVYEHVVRVCIEATDQELINGLTRSVLKSRITARDPRVRLSDLSAALGKLGRLQTIRNISPLVLGYNEANMTVFLVDRELLFYRKYGNPQWPWQDGSADEAELEDEPHGHLDDDPA